MPPKKSAAKTKSLKVDEELNEKNVETITKKPARKRKSKPKEVKLSDNIPSDNDKDSKSLNESINSNSSEELLDDKLINSCSSDENSNVKKPNSPQSLQKGTKTRRVINMQTIEDSLLLIETELIKERNNINNLLKKFSDVRKDYSRLSKEISKKGRKKNENNEKRKLTGALAPFLLDDSLCSFLGKDKGTKMSAPEVIKTLNVYIKSNNLQMEDNKTIINPDEKLNELLDLNEGDKLTYFNIQKYLAKHYIKT